MDSITATAAFARAPSERNGRFFGVQVPMLTPFDGDYGPDKGRATAFARHLLATGADGLAPFGTTSEGTSVGLAARMDLLEHMVAAGIPAPRLMPGTGVCALADAVELNRHATALGCGGVLLLPPFYYKEPDADGLFAFASELIQRVGDDRQRIWLYHIPQMAAVTWPFPVIARLLAEYRGIVVGIKDSSGDREHLRALIREFPDLTVFPGSETLLLEGLRLGAAGCISATANINVSMIRRLIDRWIVMETGPDPARDGALDQMSAALHAVRGAVDTRTFIPSLKAVIARCSSDENWRRCCPPLQAADPAQDGGLLVRLAQAGFTADPFTLVADA